MIGPAFAEPAQGPTWRRPHHLLLLISIFSLAATTRFEIFFSAPNAAACAPATLPHRGGLRKLGPCRHPDRPAENRPALSAATRVMPALYGFVGRRCNPPETGRPRRRCGRAADGPNSGPGPVGLTRCRVGSAAAARGGTRTPARSLRRPPAIVPEEPAALPAGQASGPAGALRVIPDAASGPGPSAGPRERGGGAAPRRTIHGRKKEPASTSIVPAGVRAKKRGRRSCRPLGNFSCRQAPGPDGRPRAWPGRPTACSCRTPRRRARS